MINPETLKPFRPEVQEAIQDFTETLQTFQVGKRAITIGGSTGKGIFDANSDLDFRIFHERELLWPDKDPEPWRPVWAKVAKWKERGINIDGVRPRSIGEIDEALRRAIDGQVEVDPKVWSVWGYHLLTDIDNQFIIEDPVGIIAGWHELLHPFPPKLKEALLKKHLESLRYWRADYHYRNKVQRGDPVFLAALSARLVHDIMQVLFAINERYFPGDGANLVFAQKFEIKPENLEDRLT
ncbi:MAG: DUF4037 domain-containing protein [Fimbriimonas sp.]